MQSKARFCKFWKSHCSDHPVRAKTQYVLCFLLNKTQTEPRETQCGKLDCLGSGRGVAHGAWLTDGYQCSHLGLGNSEAWPQILYFREGGKKPLAANHHQSSDRCPRVCLLGPLVDVLQDQLGMKTTQNIHGLHLGWK